MVRFAKHFGLRWKTHQKLCVVARKKTQIICIAVQLSCFLFWNCFTFCCETVLNFPPEDLWLLEDMNCFSQYAGASKRPPADNWSLKEERKCSPTGFICRNPPGKSTQSPQQRFKLFVANIVQWQELFLGCKESSLKSLTRDPFWWNIQAQNFIATLSDWEKQLSEPRNFFSPPSLKAELHLLHSAFVPSGHNVQSCLNGDLLRPLTVLYFPSVTPPSA